MKKILGLEKDELKYIGLAAIFALLWFMVLMPWLLNKGIQNSSTYIQFLLFDAGLFVIISIVLKSVVLGKWIDFKTAFGIILLFTALDFFAPPYLVNFSGNLVIDGALLSQSSVDYMTGFFAINTLHLSGIFVWVFTYLVVPFILLFIAAKLLKNFVHHL